MGFSVGTCIFDQQKSQRCVSASLLNSLGGQHYLRRISGLILAFIRHDLKGI